MITRKYKIAASALAVCGVPGGLAFADGVHDEAMRLAEAEQFDAALTVLASEDAAHQGTYDHRILKARVLSWAGRYEEAQTELGELKTGYPDNTDIDVALGNLAFYQSDLDAAEQHFQNALAIAPEHGDATSGLSRVRAARKAASENGAYRWRVDAGVGVSSFDVDAIEEWGEQFVNVAHKSGDTTVAFGATRYERFGAVDTQINAAITRAKPGSVDWGLVAAVTPEADFRSKSTLGGHVGKSFEVSETVTAHVAVHYRRDAFEDKAVQSVQPEVTTYFDNGLTLKAKAFITKEEDEDSQIGWMAEARQDLGTRTQIRIGVADAPELINGSTVNTQSVFGGVSFDVQDDLTFHINAARSDRQDLHVRTDVSIGVTRTF